MTTQGSLEAIARHLSSMSGEIFRSLVDDVQFQTSMRRLGWEVDGLPQDGSYEVAANAIRTAVDLSIALVESPEPQEILDLFQAVSSVYSALDSLGLPTGPGVDAVADVGA